jgi:threonine aldolase
VFPIIPQALDRALKAAGILYNPWTEISLPESERVGADEALIRLVTSWATREEDVRRLLEIASSEVSRQAAE